MTRRNRNGSPRRPPQLGHPDDALRAVRKHSSSEAIDHGGFERQEPPAAKDYFPLAPVVAIAMLWWIAANAVSSISGLIIATVLAIAMTWSVYRWLCGSIQRTTLLSVGLGLVFYLVYWRLSEFKPFGLGAYCVVLLLLWLVLKFGGRTHARVREDADIEPHRVSDIRNWWMDGSDWDYFPIYHRATSTLEEIWTTVSTVFQPRYPAAWSAEMRKKRHWQATLVGFGLIACGLLVTQGNGLYRYGLRVDHMALALLLVAAGWSLVGIAFELRHAETVGLARHVNAEPAPKRAPKL